MSEYALVRSSALDIERYGSAAYKAAEDMFRVGPNKFGHPDGGCSVDYFYQGIGEAPKVRPYPSNLARLFDAHIVIPEDCLDTRQLLWTFFRRDAGRERILEQAGFSTYPQAKGTDGLQTTITFARDSNQPENIPVNIHRGINQKTWDRQSASNSEMPDDTIVVPHGYLITDFELTRAGYSGIQRISTRRTDEALWIINDDRFAPARLVRSYWGKHGGEPVYEEGYIIGRPDHRNEQRTNIQCTQVGGKNTVIFGILGAGIERLTLLRSTDNTQVLIDPHSAKTLHIALQAEPEYMRFLHPEEVLPNHEWDQEVTELVHKKVVKLQQEWNVPKNTLQERDINEYDDRDIIEQIMRKRL